MYSRKLALSQAKKYRTCPPPDIADHPSHKEYLQHHLEICPYCSAQVMDEHRDWRNLARQIQERFPPGPELESQIFQGQFRHVRADQGRWHEGYFYNPPLILVLEPVTGDLGRPLVAQTYHDIYLAAPGDMILSAEQTGTDGLFVECWNTYIANPDTLASPTGQQVGPDIIEAVKTLAKDPRAYPKWAVRPKPMTDHDPRAYFRELETQVRAVMNCERCLLTS